MLEYFVDKFKIARKLNRIYRNKKLSLLQNKPKSFPVRIGFIVQLPAIWDKQVKIYEEAKARKDVEAFLFVVPMPKWDDMSIENNYEGNFFIENYPEAIRIHGNDGRIIDLRDYQLDYLFYPRPYDHYLPKPVRSRETMKYLKCCYIPYAFTASDNFNQGNIYHPFFDDIYYCFPAMPHVRQQMADFRKHELEKGIQKIAYLGYPGLETYLAMGETKKTDVVTWTPRWSYDEKLGGSHFLEYGNSFLKLCESRNESFLFRPHPLMFDELIKKNLLTKEEKEAYITALEQNRVQMDFKNPIDVVLKKTDVLISDFSSLLGPFFLTGRPIIYCDSGRIKFNNVYKELVNYMYVAHEWDDVLKYYKAIVEEKNDYLHDERISFIQEKFGSESGASKRIIDALVND
ncbi:MAG: CDP-glycerol glycerophosphotransferase family protein [Lachnospiraceae bacterium]|nr:CDP-glycerol glycerophosphotransferase family protein [Lachnospiraceae bacterium]